jgi:ABC-type phosphate/phosphonate transport system substrate-binding protein
MRDTDQDLRSLVLVRAGDGATRLEELRGKAVAVGAADSPQATLIPLEALAGAGLLPERDFAVLYHDVLVGKHGDHIGGERDAVRALLAGRADAACLIDSNYLLFTREGTIPAGAARVLLETATYDHCNFTALDDAPAALVERFRELLLGMSYADPEVRPLLDLEGLTQWRPGRVAGYRLLAQAIDRFGTVAGFLAEQEARLRRA